MLRNKQIQFTFHAAEATNVYQSPEPHRLPGIQAYAGLEDDRGCAQ